MTSSSCFFLNFNRYDLPKHTENVTMVILYTTPTKFLYYRLSLDLINSICFLNKGKEWTDEPQVQ